MEKAIRRYWPVFVLPTLIAFIIGFVWPFIWGAGLSFCKFTTVKNVQFVGLSNYAMIWSDNTFTHAFWFTAAFTVVSTLLINVLAFAIALLRAGRFDRQIHVELPDLNERKEIFGVHLRPIKIDESVDAEFLARQTPGFSGADIANVCNEAALIAARHGKKFVGKQDFLDAVDRIVGGLEKKTKITTEAERRSIAIHEAGHASISWLLEYANPLIKVTIVPRGRALGAAWYLPEERQITTKEQMLDEMCATLGGRAAEDLFLGRISTGAMNDLERVTKQAYGMIAYLGMSEKLPNLCYYNNEEYSFNRPYSEKTAELIDEEVKQMVNEQYERAKKILSENQEGHNRLAQLLIDKEVIFAEDVEHIFGKRPWASRSEEISANKTAAELKKAEQEEEQKAIEAEKEVKEEEKHEK